MSMNRPNHEILAFDWLISSHKTKTTSSDWLLEITYPSDVQFDDFILFIHIILTFSKKGYKVNCLSQTMSASNKFPFPSQGT